MIHKFNNFINEKNEKVEDSLEKHKKNNKEAYPEEESVTKDGRKNHPPHHPGVEYSSIEIGEDNPVQKFEEWVKKSRKSAYISSEVPSWGTEGKK